MKPLGDTMGQISWSSDQNHGWHWHKGKASKRATLGSRKHTAKQLRGFGGWTSAGGKKETMLLLATGTANKRVSRVLCLSSPHNLLVLVCMPHVVRTDLSSSEGQPAGGVSGALLVVSTCENTCRNTGAFERHNGLCNIRCQPSNEKHPSALQQRTMSPDGESQTAVVVLGKSRAADTGSADMKQTSSWRTASCLRH